MNGICRANCSHYQALLINQQCHTPSKNSTLMKNIQNPMIPNKHSSSSSRGVNIFFKLSQLIHPAFELSIKPTFYYFYLIVSRPMSKRLKFVCSLAKCQSFRWKKKKKLVLDWHLIYLYRVRRRFMRRLLWAQSCLSKA